MAERLLVTGLIAGLLGAGWGGILLLLKVSGRLEARHLHGWAAAWWATWMVGVSLYFWLAQGILSSHLPSSVWIARPAPPALVELGADGRPCTVVQPQPGYEPFPRRPRVVAMDGAERLYVVDSAPPRLLVMRRDGQVDQEWRRPGHPSDLALALTRLDEEGSPPWGWAVFVVDGQEQALYKLTTDGEVLGRVEGFNGERFRELAGVGVSPIGAVYLADRAAGRVWAWDERLRPTVSWGPFDEPLDASGDQQGRVFVLERFRVWVLGLEGSRRLLWESDVPFQSLAVQQDAWVSQLWVIPEQGSPLALKLPDLPPQWQPDGVWGAVNVLPATRFLWRPADVLNRCRPLPGFLLLVLAAWGLGVMLRRWLRVPACWPCQRALWNWGLGWAGWILVSFLLGALGGWRTVVVLPLLTGSALVGLPELERWVRAAIRPRRWSGEAALEWGLLAVYGGLTMLLALAPPVEADALIYHLTVPRWNAWAHRWADLPLLSAHFPMGMESLYTLGFLVGGEGVAALIHWAMGALSVLALVQLGRRWFGEVVARRAALVFASVHTVGLIASWAYVDLGAAAFQTLAIWGLWEGYRHRDRSLRGRWWRAAACCAGASLSVKLFSLVAVLLLGGTLFGLALPHERKRNAEQALGRAAWIVLGWWSWSLLWLLPFAAKNVLFVGNPLYPFLGSWLGGEFLSPERLAYMRHFVHEWTGMGRTWVHWLLLPWNVTHYGRIHDWPRFNGPLSPLLLAWAPAVAWGMVGWGRVGNGGERGGRAEGGVRRFSHLRSLWLAYVLLYFLGWAGSVQSTRQLLPLLPVAALLVTGSGWRWLRKEQGTCRWLRPLWLGVLWTQVVLNGMSLLLLAPYSERPLAALGVVPADVYLSRTCAVYDSSQWMNQHLPESARVLWLWEDRTYYSRHPALADGVLESFWWLVRWQQEDLSGWLQDLRQLGVTHLLLNRTREFYYGYTMPATFPDREQRGRFQRQFFHLRDLLQSAQEYGFLRPLHAANGCVVYQVSTVSPR